MTRKKKPSREGERTAEDLLGRCAVRVRELLPKAIELIATHQMLVIYPEHELGTDASPALVAAFAANSPGAPFVLLMGVESIYYGGDTRPLLKKGDIAISVMTSKTMCCALVGPAARLPAMLEKWRCSISS